MRVQKCLQTLAFLVSLASASANAADQILTPDGLGPVRIGMTVSQAEKALGAKLKPFNPTDGYSTASCWQTHRADEPDAAVIYMIWYGKIVRIAVYRRDDDKRSGPPIATDKGIRIGDSDARVKEVYGPSLKVEVDPQADNEEQGSDLTTFTKSKRRGITYETADRKVVNFRAGLPKATLLSEGCL
ncbi:MAG: hypothetical protein ACYCZX_05510 [Rhodospirillaceae bacterium]